jgi:ferredoxin
MKVHVNQNLCSGAGACLDVCPEMFELTERGTSVTKSEQVPSEFEQACREAADNCPTCAILIEE